MVISKSDLKRRRKNSDDDFREMSESPKRTKVHAQRKFAQSSNVNSPAITPVKEIVEKVKIDPPPPLELSPTPRPNTEDFLTFLCFRGTSILPPSLNFFNTASTVSVATQSKEPQKPEKSSEEKSDRPFIAFGVRKRADPFINKKLEKKRRHAIAIHTLRRKYQEQHIAKLRAHAIEKMSGSTVKMKKTLIRTRSATKTEAPSTSTSKTSNTSKKVIPKRIVQTVKVNVKRMIKQKMCLRSKGRFIHRELTNRPKLKRPLKPQPSPKRDKSSSDFSSDDDQPLVKTIKTVTKRIVKKSPIKEPIRITRSTPLLKRKAILKNETKTPPKETKIIPKEPKLASKETKVSKETKALKEGTKETKASKESSKENKATKEVKEPKTLKETKLVTKDSKIVAKDSKLASKDTKLVSKELKALEIDKNSSEAKDKKISDTLISQRPSRKTKEAASLYMNLLGPKLATSPLVSDDDSIDSFPELPNVRKTEQRELEMKAKAKLDSSLTRTTRRTSDIKKQETKKVETKVEPKKVPTPKPKVTEKEKVETKAPKKLSKELKALQVDKEPKSTYKSKKSVEVIEKKELRAKRIVCTQRLPKEEVPVPQRFPKEVLVPSEPEPLPKTLKKVDEADFSDSDEEPLVKLKNTSKAPLSKKVETSIPNTRSKNTKGETLTFPLSDDEEKAFRGFTKSEEIISPHAILQKSLSLHSDTEILSPSKILNKTPLKSFQKSSDSSKTVLKLTEIPTKVPEKTDKPKETTPPEKDIKKVPKKALEVPKKATVVSKKEEHFEELSDVPGSKTLLELEEAHSPVIEKKVQVEVAKKVPEVAKKVSEVVKKVPVPKKVTKSEKILDEVDDDDVVIVSGPEKLDKSAEKVQSADLLCKDLGRRFGKGKVNMSTEQIEKWLNDSAKEMEHKIPVTPVSTPEKTSKELPKVIEPEKSSTEHEPEKKAEEKTPEPPKPIPVQKSAFENLKSAFEAQKSAYEAQKNAEAKNPQAINFQKSVFGIQNHKNFLKNKKAAKPIKTPEKPEIKIELAETPKKEEDSVKLEKTTPERKFIFQKRLPKQMELKKENTKAFSPNNESSVYAFEADNEFETPLNKPFRSQFRRNSSNITSKSDDDSIKPETSFEMPKIDPAEIKVEKEDKKEEKLEGVSLTLSPDDNNSASIAVQVNLDNSDVSLECSTQTDENGSQIFYIPLQSKQAQSIIQGVAVKLGTEGNNQRVVMHAKLVTQNPDNKLPTISQKPLAQNVHMCPPVGTVQPTYRLKTDTKKIEPKETTPETKMIPSSPSASSSASSTKITKRIAKLRKNLIPCSPSNKSEFPSPSSPGKFVDALVFRPTEQEFQDPLEFIEKIRPQAEKFGLCRIIPPSTFKPECKVSDDMRFTSYNQNIHKMLNRWGPNFKELVAIKKYLATQSINLTHPPWIGGMEIDLPRLYQTVQTLGGLKEVIEKKRWPRVAEGMKIPKSAQDRVTKLDDIYCKYLLPYDTLSPVERQKLFDEVEMDWAKHESKLMSDSASSNDSDSEDYLDEIEAEECITKGRNMALNAFYRIARNTMSMYFKTTEPSSEEVENEFWKHVNERRNHVCVHSGSIDSGSWGYGFCCNKNSPFARHPWNLKILTNNSGSVLRSLGPVMGVTVPTLHVGMVFSACCWYRDPHGLPWIEYLHTGASKIWYGVPDDYSDSFQKACKKLIPNLIQNKTLWLPSDTAMVPPNLLTQNGVSLCKTVQEPGQFIVVFPKAFTSAIYTGYCVSESVYFANENWLSTAKSVFNGFRESCEPSMFSYERLLISIVSDQRTTPDILRQVLPDVESLVNHEKNLRAKIEKLGLTTLERLPLPDMNCKRKKKLQEDDGEYECEICRANLFISMVQLSPNSNEEGIYCLDHAVEYLEKKPSQIKHCKLLFTHNLKELDGLIEKINANIELKSQKKSVSKYAGMATMLK